VNAARRFVRDPVAVASAAAALVVVALLSFYALKPRDYLTGANGVRGLSLIATVPEGQRLCALDVELPAETAGIQFVLGPAGPATDAEVTIDPKGPGLRRTTLAVPAFSDAFARFEVFDAPTTGRVCIRAGAGGVVVAGASGLQSSDRPLTLEGTPLDARLSMRFLPVEGAQRSLVSQWATVMDRAALFRPGIVGPVVLWLVMLVVLPAALVAAVAAVIRGLRGRWAPVFVVAVALVSAGSWALLTLPFDSPDEAEHFAYVQSVVERNTRPDSVPTERGAYATGQTLALEAVRHPTRIGGPDQRPPWTEAARDRYEQRAAEGLSFDDGGGYAEATRLHLPAYYSLVSPGYLLGGESVLAQLTWARLFSALFGCIVALCAFGIVRELIPARPDLALVAGLLVALQPMFSFIAGSVNNDMGVNAGAALVAYLGVRVLRRATLWTAVAFAAALAVTPIMKGTGFALMPPALLVFAGFLWRRPGWRRGSTVLAAAAATFLVVGGAVRAALNGAVATGAQGPVTGEGVVGVGILGSLGGKLSYTWQVLFPKLPFMHEHFVMAWPFYDIYIVRGWGAFGWYSFAFPKAIFVAILISGALLLGAGVAAAWRRRRTLPSWIWEVGFLAAIPITVFTAIAFAYYTDQPRAIPGEQGRYLFTAAAPLAALAAMSLLGVPERWQRPAAVVLVIGMAGLAYFGRLTYLTGVFT
jgi:hypothetical protein